MFTIMLSMTGTFLPLLKDPLKLLDYENWWKKSLGNIKDYVIPALSNDIIQKLHNGLDASTERIWRTRPAEEATKIIDLLRELIDSHREDQTFKFSWACQNTKIPRKNLTKYAFYSAVYCILVLRMVVMIQVSTIN